MSRCLLLLLFMNSHRIYILSREAGFTFIEVMLVAAITLFFAGMGIFLSTDVYRSGLFRADADTVISALQRARSRAINNINESPHGVRIQTSGYTIFQGPDFVGRDASKDEFIPIGSGYTFSPTPPIDIVFQQLSGETAFDGNIVITNVSKNPIPITVNINNEGRIDF